MNAMTFDEAARPCACEWAALEARYHRAKQAQLEVQMEHGGAARELLPARAQVRRMAELFFPGPEAAPSHPVSEMSCTATGQRNGHSVAASAHPALHLSCI